MVNKAGRHGPFDYFLFQVLRKHGGTHGDAVTLLSPILKPAIGFSNLTDETPSSAAFQVQIGS